MTSKLGIHKTIGNATGWVASYLAPCAAAATPVPVIFALDQNVWNDVAANSPQTKVIFRTQKDIHGNDIGDDPGNLYTGDAVASAHGWMNLIMPMWKLNQANYYAPINEPTPPDLAGYAWLNTFMLTCMQDGDANSFKIASYAFSVGNPSDEGSTVEQKLAQLVPSLQYAKAHGHILLLHEYGLDSPAVGNAPAGTLQASTPNGALRYKRVLAYLEQHNADCPIVISEASAGTGYLPARGSLSLNQYLTDLEWYDANLRTEPRVIGCCVYQLGGAENCLELLPSLSTYIQSTGPLPPPPVVTPSASGTLVPPADKIIDKNLAVWTLDGAAVHGSILLKNGVQFGGGQGLFLLYYNDSVYTKNDDGLWFVANPYQWQMIAGDPRPTTTLRAKGIDVSHWNGVIDWARVKAGGISFAFIKSTEGTSILDSTFARNWAGAKAAGVLRGAYHFYRFAASPQTQAKNFVASMGDDFGELPLVVDVEDTALSAALCPASSIQTFISIVQSLTGRKVIIYTGSWYWPSHLSGSTLWAAAYDLWVEGKGLPSPWQTWKFWQYSAVAVDGIQNPTDIDTFNGTIEYLKDYTDHVKIVTPVPVPTPEPTSATWRGLHMRADGHSPAADLTALTVAGCTAAKIMTNTGFDELDALKVLVPVKNIVLRLFAAGDNPALGNAAQFFDQQRLWLDYFAKSGGLYVEVHNEPNLPQEGYGTFWNNGAAFGGFFAQVSDLIHVNYPSLKVGYPGLSPNTPNEGEFITSLKALISIGKVDWIGAHSYWINAADMNVTDNGRHYRRFLNMGKPVLITEFANVNTADSDLAKGQQYRAYYASLEAGVLGAFCFVSSASDPTFNNSRQTWVRNNTLTAIPAAVGL